jgi:hypothetical protein
MQNERDVKRPDLDLLPGILGWYPDIQAAYLFGSAAEGKEQADSDIELAIVPRSAESRKKKLDILAYLARAGFYARGPALSGCGRHCGQVRGRTAESDHLPG